MLDFSLVDEFGNVSILLTQEVVQLDPVYAYLNPVGASYTLIEGVGYYPRGGSEYCVDTNWSSPLSGIYEGITAGGIGCADIDGEEYTCLAEEFENIIDTSAQCCFCGGGRSFFP